MRTEKEIKPDKRYLYSDWMLSDKAVTELKNKIISIYQNRKKNNHYYKFIDWHKKENEIMIFTHWAYADFKIPKRFDCIFDLNNPNDYINLKFKLTQSIYEGLFPSDLIDEGHKHFCLFEFENDVPEIIKKLHESKRLKYDVPDNSFRLGFCNLSDFESIRIHLLRINELKLKYGSDWWKHELSE